MAPATRRKPRSSRASNKSRASDGERYPQYDLPYFAHQQLDPQKYHPNIGMPVGRPGWAPAPKEIATATNGGWGDDADAPLQEDPDNVSDAETSIGPSIKRRRPECKEEKNPYKRLKATGGRPAIAKKVTADLDSDDELIVRMKNAKYLERDIAKRLAEEGRVAYNPKTIGTRWARLRRALEKRNDELLDAELTDWHDGDDDALQRAVLEADEVINKLKSDIENKKWKIVADRMKTIKPVVNFSRNACRTRYLDLLAGTAKPTPESIIEPNIEVLKRIQSRQEKERRINEDQLVGIENVLAHQNIEGNAWTSKTRKYM